MTTFLRYANRCIGRAGELDRLRGCFAGGERLVTVVGPPGVGKTRLASELASLQRFAGTRAFFCDLSEATDLSSTCAAVARALPAALPPRRSNRELVDALGRLLAELGPVLLILDNFEQLVEPAATAIARWASLAGEASFLITSRERLRVRSERVVELLPLSTLQAGGADSDAAALLIDRLDRDRPGRQCTSDERAALAELAIRLEGLPLALELAASRIAALGIGPVLERLDPLLDSSARAPRDLSRRHQTLAGAVDWSWQLLSDSEQRVLSQASVFRGGFSLAAAEKVIDLGPRRAARLVADLVHSLREKSLLCCEAGPAPDQVRFTMYQAIRAFAAVRLGEDPRAERAAERRHAQVHLELGAAAAAAIDGPDCRWGLALLAGEQENLLVTAERVLGLKQTPKRLIGAAALSVAVRALLALFALIKMHGRLPGYEQLLDRALAQSPKALGSDARCRLLTVRAWLNSRSGHPAAARTDFEAALQLALELGDGALEGMALVELGTCLAIYGQLDESFRVLHASLSVLRRTGNRCEEGRALSDLGRIALARGDLGAARPLLNDALQIHEQCKHLIYEAYDLIGIGEWHLSRGELDDADHCLHRAEVRFVAAALDRLLFLWAVPIGMMHHARGELELAAKRYEQSAHSALLAGATPHRATALGYLGLAQHELGRLEDANHSLCRALSILEPLGDLRQLALFTAFLGAVHASAGRLGLAEVKLQAASAAAQDDGLRAAIAAARVVFDLAEAARQGNSSRALEQTWATLDQVRSSSRLEVLGYRFEGGAPLEVVLALRLAALACAESHRAGSDGARSASSEALVVNVDGSWFRLPSRAATDIRNRHPPLRGILAALAMRRLEAPGKPVTQEELLAAGWPGCPIQPEAAASRVRMAILTLRKLGLRDLLCTVDGGYLFSSQTMLKLERSQSPTTQVLRVEQ